MDKISDIYATMLGEMLEPVKGVQDEFIPGSHCDRLYTDAADARNRLLVRLGVDEDPDLEMIFDSFCDLTMYLSRKMFEYGMIADQL